MNNHHSKIPVAGVSAANAASKLCGVVQVLDNFLFVFHHIVFRWKKPEVQEISY